MKYIILDTETTGLNYKKDRIIEISLLKIKKNFIKSSIHKFFNVKRKISREAFKVHGIKKNFLKKKKEFKFYYKKIKKYINNNIIVSHNAKFDINFLKKEYKIIGENINFKAIDTLKIARKMFVGKRNNLESLGKRMKIKTNIFKNHSAYDDSLLLYNIFIKIKSRQIKVRVS
ncbi:3'-5' exonuclease [Candidatus Vidania fulgoroideorum]